MTAFKIMVADEEWVKYSTHTYAAVDRLMGQLKPPDFKMIELYHLGGTEFSGTGAPPELVTLLAALAQGHDVLKVINQILKMQTEGKI